MTSKGDFDLVIQSPGIGRIDLILHPCHFVVDFLHRVVIQRFATFCAQFVVTIEQRSTGSDGFLDIVPNIFVGVELRLLRQDSQR